MLEKHNAFSTTLLGKVKGRQISILAHTAVPTHARKPSAQPKQQVQRLETLRLPKRCRGRAEGSESQKAAPYMSKTGLERRGSQGLEQEEGEWGRGAGSRGGDWVHTLGQHQESDHPRVEATHSTEAGQQVLLNVSLLCPLPSGWGNGQPPSPLHLASSRSFPGPGSCRALRQRATAFVQHSWG